MTGGSNERSLELRLERVFDAPPEEVFRAWTTPADLQQWAWGSLGKDVTADVELTRGGRYRVETARPDGSRWAFSGTYREVVPGKRLVYTVAWDAPMGYESAGETVSVDLLDRDGKTAVALVHDGVPEGPAQEEHARGWQDTFDHLQQLLASR